MRMIRLPKSSRELHPLWLTRRKRPGKNCREAAVSPALVTARLTARGKFYSMESANYRASADWHEARIVNGGGEGYGSGLPLRTKVSFEGSIGMRGIQTLRIWALAVAVAMALAGSIVSAQATSRIKDLANIEGVRQNQLIGYGL